MALLRSYLDKFSIPRKDFADLFKVDSNDDFYVAVKQIPNGMILRTAPWARSSHLLKGAKYNRSMQIARRGLKEQHRAQLLNVYTAYSPDDSSYFVSGYETLIKSNEDPSLTEEKIKALKASWGSTIQQMQTENIDVWSK